MGLIVLGLAVLLAPLAGTARAEISPEWTERLPVGSALAAGIQEMVVDASGVTYVTGIEGASSNTDVRTAAYASDGTLIWSQSFNGPMNWHDQSRGIALGPDGVVYVTGNTPGSGFFANVLVLKYDAHTGTLLDTIQYSSGPGTSEHGASVVADENGNIYIGGGTVGDGGDALILKFDANGQFQWKEVWDGPAFGPYSQDHADEVLLDPNGDLIVRIYGVMGSMHADYVVIKYDPSNGDIIWDTNWGLSGEDAACDMEIDSNGDIYLTGTGLDFSNKYSTIKLRGTDGALLWQEYDSDGLDDFAVELTLDGVGGVFITGSPDPDGDFSNFNNNIYTVKRDAATGAFQWDHLYGANCIGCFDVPGDVAVDPAGNVFVAGYTSSPPYSADLILLVLDTDTGNETERAIVSGDTFESNTPEILAFDSAYNLYCGSDLYHVNTGAVTVSLTKFTTLLADQYQLAVTNLVAGSDATLSVANATPGKRQFVVYSIRGLGSTPVPGLGVTLDLENPRLGVYGFADGSGTFETTVPVPPDGSGLTIWFQAAEQGRITPVFSRVVE
jgi:hypothetical protein